LDNILLIPVFLPLAAGFVMLFFPGRLGLLAKALTLVVSVASLGLAIRIFRLGGLAYQWPLFEIADVRFDISLVSGPLGAFILMFACGFGLLITVYSLRKCRPAQESAGTGGPGPVRSCGVYYGSVCLTIGGAAGILLADNLLFLLVCWEIVTAALYLLITTGHRRTDFAATKSFAMIGASDAALLLGILTVWGICGSLSIGEISAAPIATTSALSIAAFLLLMAAAITKAGALPFHTWLPTAGQAAPASVMALLPAAIDKLLGIYLLVVVARGIFSIESAALGVVLAAIGSATIIIAVMMAMVQHNFKKLLSYHAVSQVGYMVLGIATGTAVGIAGAVFHMLNNAIYKSCLFLCAGSVEESAGTGELDRLGGLGSRMWFTFGACLVAALSISGVPPFNGFASKWMVYQGVISMKDAAAAGSGLWPVWLTAAVFGSALTLASFVKVIHSVFLGRLPDGLKSAREAPVLRVLPCVVLAVLCIFFGIAYRVPLGLFIYPGLGMEAASESPVFLGAWDSQAATVLLLMGVVIGLILLVAGLAAQKARQVATWTCGEIQPNEQIRVPGTHFYKTISSMGGLSGLYRSAEKGRFDPYDQSSRVGLALSEFLRWLHCGVLPVYLSWVTVGLVLVLYVVCKIW
jgi:formate hydrogenlyase subunit 3/multisubunit Na+/H+ antiporter MnhD subunit